MMIALFSTRVHTDRVIATRPSLRGGKSEARPPSANTANTRRSPLWLLAIKFARARPVYSCASYDSTGVESGGADRARPSTDCNLPSFTDITGSSLVSFIFTLLRYNLYKRRKNLEHRLSPLSSRVVRVRPGDVLPLRKYEADWALLIPPPPPTSFAPCASLVSVDNF